MLGSMTDAGQTVMKAIQALAKIAPEGASSPGVETTALRDLMQQNQAQAPMLQLMRSMGGGAAAGAPPQAA
jgi:hypothetical protein